MFMDFSRNKQCIVWVGNIMTPVLECWNTWYTFFVNTQEWSNQVFDVWWYTVEHWRIQYLRFQIAMLHLGVALQISNRSRPSKLSIEIWNNQLARLTHGGKSQASSYDVLGPHANGPSTQHAEIKSMFVLIGSWRFPCASLGWGLHYLRFILCGDDVLIDQRPRLHEVLSTCVWLTAGHVFQTPHTMTEVIAVISHNWSSKFLPESKINSDSLQFIVYIIPKFQTVKSLNQSPVQSFLTIQTQSFNATNLDMLKPFSTVLIVPKLK